MEQPKEKRKYTFTALSENSRNALIEANKNRINDVKLKWENIKNNNEMKCKVCDVVKELNSFNKINISRNLPYDSWSSECKLCELNRKNKDRSKRADKNGLEYNVNCILKEIKRRADKHNRDFDLNLDFLLELYNKQNGICPYSGKNMIFSINSQERLSLDRKDSSLGYIKTNVIWCCWAANNIKQYLSIEDMKKWVADIHKIIN